MTEPLTEAGRVLLREHSSGTPHMARHVAAIEAEARATLAPDARLREATDYAAEAAHHRYWDSNVQDGHTGQDWRECNAWPCLVIVAAREEMP